MINKIKGILSYLWRNTLLKWYRNHTDEDRKKIKLGKENPDKIFFVIKRMGRGYNGLFSDFLVFLGKIDAVLKEGYIPIVDMQSDFNMYLEKDAIGGTKNAWEYYFKQPMGFSLEDISRSRHVIFGTSDRNLKLFPWDTTDFLYGRTGELDYWKNLARKYMQLNDTARQRVEDAYQKLFVAGKDAGEANKILGVLCRGTDYVQYKPSKHNIQPTPEEMFVKIDEVMKEQNCNRIFLATEDGAIYRKFREKYGDILLTNKKQYTEYLENGGGIGRVNYENGNGGYEAGMEYLITILLLSRCDCLCAGIASGTGAAILLSEGYQYLYLFDLGQYE